MFALFNFDLLLCIPTGITDPYCVAGVVTAGSFLRSMSNVHIHRPCEVIFQKNNLSISSTNPPTRMNNNASVF